MSTQKPEQMFIEALFLIAKTWKQSTSPSVSEWINGVHPDYGILFNTLKK